MADDALQPVIDADQHYYEALDAFTRHLDPAMADRCVRWCEVDGRRYHVVGGVVNHAVTNPTFDPVAPPGSLRGWFSGNEERKLPFEYLTEREPIRPEYRDRDARLERLDAQGLEACLLFPTLGMLYEEALKHDPEAVCTTFRAFNRWLADDWGFAYRDRIFAGPYLSLADRDWAVEELTWALEAGARTVVLRPAAPTTATGRRSPFDPWFDRFWSLVDEAGITVVVHAGDGGTSFHGYAAEEFSANLSGGMDQKLSLRMFAIEQAVSDWLMTAMLEQLFTRFPNVRIASIENGAEFLPDLVRKLRSTAKKIPGWWPDDDPVAQLREHVWVSPFWEDDAAAVAEVLGADRVLFGSDWPHIECIPEPRDYEATLTAFDEADRRRILHDNVAEVMTLRPRGAA